MLKKHCKDSYILKDFLNMTYFWSHNRNQGLGFRVHGGNGNNVHYKNEK